MSSAIMQELEHARTSMRVLGEAYQTTRKGADINDLVPGSGDAFKNYQAACFKYNAALKKYEESLK